MKTIHLHGYLKERFGASFTFDVSSPAEMICALRSQLKGFAEAIRDGKFIVIRGERDQGISIDETELGLRFGKTRQMHLIPALEGSGGRAVAIVKIVLGVALLAVGVGGAILAGAAGATAFSIGAFAVSWGSIASVGVAVTVAGVSAALTPRANLKGPQYEQRESPDSRPSFLFNGPRNQSSQGLPVPLVYGRMRVGSMVVSTGLTAERI